MNNYALNFLNLLISIFSHKISSGSGVFISYISNNFLPFIHTYNLKNIVYLFALRNLKSLLFKFKLQLFHFLIFKNYKCLSCK